jgi:hypothetical protein
MFPQIVPMKEERRSGGECRFFTGASMDKFDSERERRGVVQEGIIERRQHTRYAVDARAEVLVHDGTMLFRGRVLDVSLGGCYIETEARLRLPPGAMVEMVFRTKEETICCDAMCRMLRPKGAGFLFMNLDTRTERELAGLIRELSAG